LPRTSRSAEGGGRALSVIVTVSNGCASLGGEMNNVRRGRRDQGAAAVEFALVVPILLAVMLGIVDYGMWFSDTLSTRQGVREAARLAVVESYNGGGCASSKSLDEVACTVDDRIGAISGPTWVRVKSTKADGSAGWEQGGSVTVCAIVKSNGLTGFTPMPNNHIVFSSIVMRIEDDTTPPTGPSPYVGTRGGTLPPGFTWSGSCA
jgi:Flp pilus assembly pilin Flp